MKATTLAIATLVLSVGCDLPTSRQQEADRLSLFRADSLFAYETAERGAEGWASHFESDGVMFPPSGRVDGRDAIRERMQGVFTEGAPSLEWTPTEAVVSAGGNLGYTLGRWESRAETAAGGDSVIAAGHYVTIWKRDSTGQWRVAVDIGNRD